MSIMIKEPGDLLLDGVFWPAAGEGAPGPERDPEGVILAMSPALNALARGLLCLEHCLHRDGRGLSGSSRENHLFDKGVELCRLRGRLLADFGRLQGMLDEVWELTRG